MTSGPQLLQTCPECGFSFAIAQDELADVVLGDPRARQPLRLDQEPGEPLVVCPECGSFFDFDPEAPERF